MAVDLCGDSHATSHEPTAVHNKAGRSDREARSAAPGVGPGQVGKAATACPPQARHCRPSSEVASAAARKPGNLNDEPPKKAPRHASSGSPATQKAKLLPAEQAAARKPPPAPRPATAFAGQSHLASERQAPEQATSPAKRPRPSSATMPSLRAKLPQTRGLAKASTQRIQDAACGRPSSSKALSGCAHRQVASVCLCLEREAAEWSMFRCCNIIVNAGVAKRFVLLSTHTSASVRPVCRSKRRRGSVSGSVALQDAAGTQPFAAGLFDSQMIPGAGTGKQQHGAQPSRRQASKGAGGEFAELLKQRKRQCSAMRQGKIAADDDLWSLALDSEL
jgi:hypothetical protein